MLGIVPLFFFFNDTPTTEIYTLSLHDALPICKISFKASSMRLSNSRKSGIGMVNTFLRDSSGVAALKMLWPNRSEEHTSELQSQSNLVCRLLLEKKKNK